MLCSNYSDFCRGKPSGDRFGNDRYKDYRIEGSLTSNVGNTFQVMTEAVFSRNGVSLPSKEFSFGRCRPVGTYREWVAVPGYLTY